MQVLHGERIGKNAQLRVGCSATIFNTDRDQILITRRTDNGRWCIPGGGTDPGESVTETCEREVFEETGLAVRACRLTGIYSSPDRILEYDDGNRFQPIAFNFEVEILSGELALNDECSEVKYFPIAELHTLDFMTFQLQRIEDALANQETPFLR